jgi:hypothetical protein
MLPDLVVVVCWVFFGYGDIRYRAALMCVSSESCKFEQRFPVAMDDPHAGLGKVRESAEGDNQYRCGFGGKRNRQSDFLERLFHSSVFESSVTSRSPLRQWRESICALQAH